MATTAAREQLEQAMKLRDRRHYILLAGSLVGVTVAGPIAALRIFPSIPDGGIMLIGFGSALVVANLIYKLQIRKFERPKCPACGIEWDINEAGARLDKGISASGRARYISAKAVACPKCGAEI